MVRFPRFIANLVQLSLSYQDISIISFPLGVSEEKKRYFLDLEIELHDIIIKNGYLIE